MMNKIKKISKWIVCGIGILIFATIVVMLLTNNVTGLDNSIYNIIISSKSDVMTMFMTIITMMCNTEFIIVATLLLVLLIKNKKIGGMIASNVVLCSVINTIIKHIFLNVLLTLIYIIIINTIFIYVILFSYKLCILFHIPL